MNHEVIRSHSRSRATLFAHSEMRFSYPRLSFSEAAGEGSWVELTAACVVDRQRGGGCGGLLVLF